MRRCRCLLSGTVHLLLFLLGFLKRITSGLWKLTVKAHRLENAVTQLVRDSREKQCRPRREHLRVREGHQWRGRAWRSLGYRWEEIYDRQEHILEENVSNFWVQDGALWESVEAQVTGFTRENIYKQRITCPGDLKFLKPNCFVELKGNNACWSGDFFNIMQKRDGPPIFEVTRTVLFRMFSGGLIS